MVLVDSPPVRMVLSAGDEELALRLARALLASIDALGGSLDGR